MKRSRLWIGTLLIICMIAVMIPAVPVMAAGEPAAVTAAGAGFKDVQDPKAFFYNSVYWAVDEGVTEGTSKDAFSPEEYCSRAQIVTFLFRLSGENAPAQSSGFSDVGEKAYYADAVSWAVAREITSGTTPSTFSPNDTCTRAQIVTFLWRMAGKPSVPMGKMFSDVKDTDYFVNAVQWALDNEVTAGVSESRFDPQGKCTRAQAVTFIHRYFRSVTDPSAPETVDEDMKATFSCDPDYVKAGVRTKVRFYAGGITGSRVQAVPADGSDAVAMNDAGEDGDVEAGDGIYTGTGRVTVAEGGTSEFNLTADGKKKASLTIRTYTAQDFADSRDVMSTISAESEDLTEEFQSIIKEAEDPSDEAVRKAALEEIGADLAGFLNNKKSDGEILSWKETDGTYYITLPAGTCVVPLKALTGQDEYWGTAADGSGDMAPAGSDAALQDSLVTTQSTGDPDGTQSLIASIEPFYLESVTEWHDKSAELIQDSISGFRFASTVDHDFNSNYYSLDGQPVLAAQAMNFYRDQLDDYNVIIWNGHGVYTNDAGAFLYSGVYHNDLVDELYADDIASGRLYWSVIGKGKNDVMYGLTGGFIQYHYRTKGHRLNDALVYVGACHGGQYGGVCRSFIASGAKAAVGFDEAINKTYEADFVEDFFNALVKKNVFNGQSAEVTSAFNTAVFKNKAFETVLHAAGQPAKAVLFKAAGPDYRLTDYAFHKPDNTGPEEDTDLEPSEGCVFFGNYYQSQVKDADLKALQRSAGTDDNGLVQYSGKTNKLKGSEFYRKDPIEWIILNESGGAYTLLSKKILEFRAFGDAFWHESPIRTWLNGDFYNEAFSGSEQADIRTVSLSTWYHPYQDAYIDHNPAQYVTTENKVWLLDMDEIQSAAYGFEESTGASSTRVAYATPYANTKEAAGTWWVRGAAHWNYGNLQERYIKADGSLTAWYGTYSYGVRPVIRVSADAAGLIE